MRLPSLLDGQAFRGFRRLPPRDEFEVGKKRFVKVVAFADWIRGGALADHR